MKDLLSKLNENTKDLVDKKYKNDDFLKSLELEVNKLFVNSLLKYKNIV